MKLQEANNALEAVRAAALKIPDETGKTRLIDAGAAVIGMTEYTSVDSRRQCLRKKSW